MAASLQAGGQAGGQPMGLEGGDELRRVDLLDRWWRPVAEADGPDQGGDERVALGRRRGSTRSAGDR
jgi:hypothetical protein